MNKLPALLCMAVAPMALATVDDRSDNRQDVYVAGRHATTVMCQSSASGRCYNVLFAPNGAVLERFSLRIGESRIFIDLPDAATVCLTDARLDDAQPC